MKTKPNGVGPMGWKWHNRLVNNTANRVHQVKSKRPRLTTERISHLMLLLIALALFTNMITMVATTYNPPGSDTIADIPAQRLSWQALLSVTITSIGVFVGYRFNPYIGTAVIAAGCICGALLGYHPVAEWSVACFNAFLLTVRGARAVAVGATAALGNLLCEGIAVGHWLPTQATTPSIAAFIALMLATAGSALFNSRRYREELEARTEEAIASRETAIERGIVEERLRIARDLHDSVGHNIAVVNMHLGSAEVSLPPDADTARSELEAARAGIKGVLTETQQILKVLRVKDDSDEAAPPTLASIGNLIDTFTGAGLAVEASLPDLSRPLPKDTSTAIFRIVQESLTNAQKHGIGRVTLSISFTDNEVLVETMNMSSPRRNREKDSVSGGNGLVGIQERAASVGGTVEVTDDGHTFWLKTRLPINRKETHK